MKRIKIIALLLALLTGLSAYYLINTLINSQTKDYIEIVVASKVVPMRSVLTNEMLSIKKIPAAGAHSSSARRMDQAVGMICTTQLEVDEQIILSKLVQTGKSAGGFSYIIPSGKRAFTIQVDNITGIAGFIQPGDRVDVMSTIAVDASNSYTNAKVPSSLILLQNIEVLAAGTNINKTDNEKNIKYDTVTLAVSSQEMVNLNLASSEGKVRLALRQPQDTDFIKILPQNTEIMVNSLK